jgi:RNA polymerase sigma-70 factor (ECF subfamily)
MEQPDSLHLIAAAQAGKADALDQLLRRHLPDLRVFVRAKSGEALRHQESCSDLVQTVCREALANLDGYEWRGEGTFRHWLFSLAMNKLRNRADHYAAARRDVGRTVPGEGTASQPGILAAAAARDGTPSQQAIGREAVAKFETCLDGLPELDREVILLARVVGLSHLEIAAELGIAEGAVRTRLSRALARLATLMAAAGPS